MLRGFLDDTEITMVSLLAYAMRHIATHLEIRVKPHNFLSVYLCQRRGFKCQLDVRLAHVISNLNAGLRSQERLHLDMMVLM